MVGEHGCCPDWRGYAKFVGFKHEKEVTCSKSDVIFATSPASFSSSLLEQIFSPSQEATKTSLSGSAKTCVVGRSDLQWFLDVRFFVSSQTTANQLLGLTLVKFTRILCLNPFLLSFILDTISMNIYRDSNANKTRQQASNKWLCITFNKSDPSVK